MFRSAGCCLLRVEDFSCNFDVLYGGPGIRKMQFIKKILHFFQLYILNWLLLHPFHQHLYRQQVVPLSQSSCVSPVELTNGRGGEGEGKKSQIIRRRESLVLYISIYHSILSGRGGPGNCSNTIYLSYEKKSFYTL
jgi:hypothetical protein